MATQGLSSYGEEFAQKAIWRADLIAVRPSEIEIGFYNDSTDTIGDTDDIGAITSEPATGNYARKVAGFDGSAMTLSQNQNGNMEMAFHVTYDVTNTTETIDSWFAVASFQSDIVGSDTQPTNHLIVSATLDQGTRDLSQNETVDLDGFIAMT